MEYTMPEKAAEPVNGGDGYDLEFVFNKKLEGTTCTYDDLIFMPGTLRDDECDDASMIDFRGESRWCHSVVTEHSVLFCCADSVTLLSLASILPTVLTVRRLHQLPHGPGGSVQPLQPQHQAECAIR